MLTLAAGNSLRGPGIPRPHRSTGQRAWQRGFTLLELMVVVAIIAIATAGVSLALPSGESSSLEREGSRLSALLEAGRAQSRSSGVALRWQADAQGFRFVPGPSAVTPWLSPALRASTPLAGTSEGVAILVLGPEPIIAAQSVTLVLAGRRLRVGTDGLRPFAVQSDTP